MSRPLQVGDFLRSDNLSEKKTTGPKFYSILTIETLNDRYIITARNTENHADIRKISYDSDGLHDYDGNELDDFVTFGQDLNSLKFIQVPLNYYERARLAKEIFLNHQIGITVRHISLMNMHT